MKRIVPSLILAATVFAAHASETIRAGDKVVSVGDGVGKVTQAFGSPDRIEPIENDRGALRGERYVYVRDGKTVQITVVDSKVTKIDEIR